MTANIRGMRAAAIRLPQPDYARICELAVERRQDLSDVVQAAVRYYLEHGISPSTRRGDAGDGTRDPSR